MIIAKTDRLILRTFDNKDVDFIMKFWGNEEVMKYCGKHSNEERILKSIEFYKNLQNERSFSTYGVTLKENGEVIGACGFNPSEYDNEVELIFHFSKEYWGKGYATEAANACINYVRDNSQIEKIIASVDPKNIASDKVLRKLGFEFKGMEWFEDTKQEESCFELSI